MSKLLTVSLLGIILAPCSQMYTMDKPAQTSWFSQNPVAVIAATVGTAAMGYAGYILKKRYDRKEKLISKKEAAVGISASLAAGAFFLDCHRNYRIIAPQAMVFQEKFPDHIPWSQSEVLWQTFKYSPISLWKKSFALTSEFTGFLAKPLKIFPAVFDPIDSALGHKGLCGSLILPAAAHSAYGYVQGKYAQKGSDFFPLYAPKKEACKGFASIVGGVPDLMEHVMAVCKATPEQIQKCKVKMLKGILFYGPPGTGKTALARALAEELILQDVQTVTLIGSAGELKDKWIGGGVKNIKALFAQARSYAQQGNKVIVFIDEIDSLAAIRQESVYGEKNETINQFLAELDGINQDANNNIIIIGATNRFESLDSAVTRGGRLEYHIEIPLPSFETKKDLLASYLEKAGFEEIPPLEPDEHNQNEVSLAEITIDNSIDSHLQKDISPADIKAWVKKAQLGAFGKKEPLSLEHLADVLKKEPTHNGLSDVAELAI